MKKIILGITLCFLLLISGATLASTIQLNSQHPSRYVVQQGDTLWSIASKFLQDPWQWSELWHANPSIGSNPNLIYPGDVLEFSTVNGKPTLQRVRRGTLKLSPKVRQTKAEQPIPTIPYEVIKPYLRDVQVVSPLQVEHSPMVIAFVDGRLAGVTDAELYAKGIKSDQYQTWGVYRRGAEFVNPDTKKLMGLEAVKVADADLLDVGKPSTLAITSAKQEILIGDMLMPNTQKQATDDFMLSVPSKPVRGQIIYVLSHASQIAPYEIVAVNVGYKDGVRVGNVLSIDSQSEYVTDPTKVHKSSYTVQSASYMKKHQIKLPERKLGYMVIFKVYDHIGFGLVMNTKQEASLYDYVQNP